MTATSGLSHQVCWPRCDENSRRDFDRHLKHWLVVALTSWLGNERSLPRVLEAWAFKQPN